MLWKRVHGQMYIILTGCLILIGLGLAGVGSVLHPITINPWGGSAELHKAANGDNWVIVHTIMIIAITIWLGGMVFAAQLCKSKLIKLMAIILYMVSLTIWLLVLGMELTVFPPIFSNLTDHTHQTIGSLFFGYGLFSGYVAMVLIWFATCLLSFSLKSLMGTISNVIGVIGTSVAILTPNLFLLIIVTIPPTLWAIVFAIKLIRT